MQRMGDLILSFPLLGLLQKKFPNNPLWTVAEPCFFTQFYDFTPKTVFFPPTAAKQLQSQAYEMVINLSHREDAKILAGQVQAEKRYGFYQKKSTTYIGGEWPLYRASMVQNNHFNLFHWSDLYVLEHLQGAKIPPWKTASSIQQHEKIIGIFVGASEKEKRPTPLFFAKLAKSLSRKGYRTFFLGGPEDIPIANEAVALSGLQGASLCGTFNLKQLVVILKKLALFITADTGPMHLAAWVHTPILNISLGPVNPWETGPRAVSYAHNKPANYIVQPNIACSACWKACYATQRCQDRLHPERIALLAHAILHTTTENNMLNRIELPGLNVFRTANDAFGRYDLVPLNATETGVRHTLGKFWQSWFWYRLQKNINTLPHEQFHEQFHEICVKHQHTGHMLRHGILELGNTFRKYLKQSFKNKNTHLPAQLWKYFPAVTHPLSSFLQLYIQNNEYSHGAWEQVLQDLEDMYTIVSG